MGSMIVERKEQNKMNKFQKGVMEIGDCYLDGYEKLTTNLVILKEHYFKPTSF